MVKAKAYIGVDPGKKGSLCLLKPSTKQVAFMSTDVLPKDLFDWFMTVQNRLDLIITMIEDVHSIHGTSAKSNFNLGYNVGMINSIPKAAGASVDLVTPKKWQKFIGVKSKGKQIKHEVADICERLYPRVEIRGPRGGLLDGRSDALMIAHYASQTFKS